ncbi:MAG: AAA family ATPase, partial [Leptolyngbyaceae cyanobacterium bins.302]|nr:AAA family ATPase [Leptolyngbyaceae cyanobacterium bins.302]
IHKDINPANILIHPQTKLVKLIDFSLASRSTADQGTENLNGLEGTLAYLAPEQTGRMNQAIDHRTDLYSLGATFYAMLTGQCPFQTQDPLELVHCHIAKTPPSPASLNTQVPHVISELVMKLLAKTPAERYQSAWGLKADLLQCQQLLAQSRHPTTLPRLNSCQIGELDRLSQFLIPEKLYGRENEVAALLAAFDRVSTGTTEVMLVSGYSGVGKSTLVHHLHQAIVQQQGYFIAGKFDQFKRNIPYASLVQAFQELIRQLLTEREDKIALWRSNLLKALGANGKIIIDLIPEVEQIIGVQPEVAPVSPLEAQNRFNRVFQQFIQVFSQPEHPLVLFLDDLHWVDLPSLKLIELIVAHPNSRHLFLLGAYRDNEVNATHPLLRTLEQMQVIVPLHNLVLQPLDVNQVNQLIADTLRLNAIKTRSLAALLFKKTQGNPFFLTQLLKSLHQEKQLIFDFNQASWQWNIDILQEITITENVVELMISHIQKLSPKTQQILKLAACIGDKFSLDVLAIVHNKPLSKTANDLWEALQAELIVPLSPSSGMSLVPDLEAIRPESVARQPSTPEAQITYQFLHDRVQQAAYSLIPESQRAATHLKIGRSLLQNTATERQKEIIFSLINQLNQGVHLLEPGTEKIKVAELNLIAGQKAKLATAYEAASRYLSTGLDLLESSDWNQHYHLTLALHQEAAETAFLLGDYPKMQQRTELILQSAQTPLDQVKAYELRIKTCEVQRKLLDAVELGLQALNLLGVNLLQSPTAADIHQVIAETNTNLASRGIDDLLHLPAIADANKLAALQLLASLVPAAYQSTPELFTLMACQQVNLTIQFGHHPLAPSGFADYGIIFSGILQDVEASYQFGQLALKLLERLTTRHTRSQTLFKVSTFILPWKHPLRETLSLLQDAYLSGLENGDLAHAGYSLTYKCQYSYWSGVDLRTLEQEMVASSAAIAQINQETALKWHQIFHQAVLNLLGFTANPGCLMGAAYNEAQFLSLHIQLNERTVVHYVFLNKLILSYLFGQITQAIDYAINAKEYINATRGWFTVPIFTFYDSLAHLALYPSVPTSQQQQILQQVSANQSQMRHWASHAPMNFQHKYELVEAELARVLGQYWQAMAHYDRAIAGAKAQGYIQEAALANERAADFYLAQGREKIAQTYLIEAYYGYLRWGATAKVQDLTTHHPTLLAQTVQHAAIEIATLPTTTSISTGGSKAFDFATVMKASQALSGAIVLSELLTKLMQIVLENAGAEKGFLLLDKAGQLLIEATGQVGSEEIIVQQSIPIEDSDRSSTLLPISMINYVARTKGAIVLKDANTEEIFASDPYITTQNPKSVLCTPILHQSKLTGILYLENNLTTGAFTQERLDVLQLLAAQAAISIENARLYADLAEANRTLEAKVAERTVELQAKNLHLQQEIRERQKAEETAKIASRAKSEFLTNMSHELRTPLNGILGYSQVLRKNKILTEQQQNGLNVIYQCGEYLLTLINDVLDLSKIEVRKMELHPSTVNLPQFLEKVLQICRIRASQKQITLDYEVLSPLPQFVQVDEKRLQQVLLNLLGNAIKFTSVGSVTFKVGVVEQSGAKPQTQAANTLTGSHLIRFQIEDTGVGISPSQLEQIFQPFHRGNEPAQQTEGTGLGLAISRQLIQLMGGEIHVESVLEQGSNFWLELELPETYQNCPVVQPDPRSIAGYIGARRTVLVVDDKDFNRQIIADLLQPLGFRVIEATNGQEGLERALAQKPDLVLVDLVMPRMDGFEMARRLKRTPELKTTIVLAISASVFDFDQRLSQEACCDDFIPKPIYEAVLLEKIQSYLGLEWVYETAPLGEQANQEIPLASSSARGSIPTQQDLSTLLDLALMGDLKGIVAYTQHLEQLDPQQTLFIAQLRQLAKNFKGKQTIEFIKQFQAQR